MKIYNCVIIITGPFHKDHWGTWFFIRFPHLPSWLAPNWFSFLHRQGTDWWNVSTCRRILGIGWIWWRQSVDFRLQFGSFRPARKRWTLKIVLMKNIYCNFIWTSFISYLMSLLEAISSPTVAKMRITRNRGPHRIQLRWQNSGRAATNGYPLGMLKQTIILCKWITFECINCNTIFEIIKSLLKIIKFWSRKP